jgi:hypothetical protein
MDPSRQSDPYRGIRAGDVDDTVSVIQRAGSGP